MNKDFNREKLLSFSSHKQIKALFDLAQFIEKNNHTIDSSHFTKLKKYHHYLEETQDKNIQKLNKEFQKIIQIDYQFQVYLMNLERLLGQSSKEYDFLVNRYDSESPIHKFPIICVLDSVRSAHNVGAMLRNAECFGVTKVFLTGLSPNHNHEQVQKTSMGVSSYLEIEYKQDALELVKKLKTLGHFIVAIETANSAIPLNKFSAPPSSNLVLLFGHEQFGLSKELIEISDKIVKIPLFGQKNSLNVAVSQAIILNHLVNN